MDKKMDLLKWLFHGLIFTVALLFLLGEYLLPTQKIDEMHCEQFDVPWRMVREDGSVSDIRIPGNYDVERNEKIIVETVLPENIEENHYLCFYSNRQEMEIYVDGELRQQYSTLSSKPYGHSSTSAFVFLKIEKGDKGKVLSVSYQTDTGYSGKLLNIYYGDKMGIWSALFKERGGQLIASLIMLILGVASVVGSLIMRFYYHKPLELEYLGWGVIFAACWMISDSIFRQLIFPNASIVNDLAFVMVMMLPLPFMIYLNEIQKRRYNIFYVIVSTMVIIDMVVCVTLQFLNIVDFADSISVFAMFCGVAILLMAVTIVIDCVKGYIGRYKLVAVGIVGASLAGAVQLVLYFSRKAYSGGVIIAYGMIFLLLISTINSFLEVLHMESEKQQAIYANESKARFLANMSHEIRTPINAVLGMDEMILKESTEQNIKEYAMDIQNAGKNLLALINDILDFSKIESGNMEINPVEYQLSSLICDCYNMVSIKANEKKLKFIVENDITLPESLYGDEVRVRQVIVNLLTNAVKYTKEGSITMSVQGKRLEDGRLLLQISVQDTGMGITKENCAKLFDSFKRVDEKKNRNIEGTGLGLAITKQIVELMQGSIAVESEYGKGSVFRVEFPQNIVDNRPVGEFAARIKPDMQQSVQKAEMLVAPEGKILVVDDVEMNLKVFTGLLKQTQLQIDTALSGKKALEMASQKKYHMIFMDHMMPEMDGIETLHALKQMKSCPNEDTPVIILTANAIVGVREEYLQEGFSDYLSKPVQCSQLEEMIKKFLPADITDAEKLHSQKEKENVTSESEIISKIDFLDTKAGMKFCSDSEEFYLEVMKTYVESDKMQMLEQFYAQQDWGNYRIYVHSLKSNSLYIGADKLAGHAKDLEMAAKNGDADFIRLHNKDLLDEYKELTDKLKAVLSDAP